MFAVAGGPFQFAEAYRDRALFRSKDGGTTFQKVNHPLVNGAGKVISAFEYDPQADTLYATWIVNNSAPNSTGIIRLRNASAGDETWEALADPADPKLAILTAVAYDQSTGMLTVGGQYDFGPQDGRRAVVWVSSDGGTSWTQRTKGLKDEKVNFLTFDQPVLASSVRMAAVESRIVQGSSTGLYSLKPSAGNITPTPMPNPTPIVTPTPSDTSCSLKLDRSCKGTLKKGAICKMTAAIKSKRPTKETKVNLEFSSSSTGVFKPYSPKTRLNQRTKLFSMKVKTKGYIRAVFDQPACESKSVLIKIAGRT